MFRYLWFFYLYNKGQDYINHKFTLRNISLEDGSLHNDRNYIGTVRVANQHMYVPIGSDGLDIYKINMNGDLEFIKNLDSFEIYQRMESINIVDVAIGGKYAN